MIYCAPAKLLMRGQLHISKSVFVSISTLALVGDQRVIIKWRAVSRTAVQSVWLVTVVACSKLRGSMFWMSWMHALRCENCKVMAPTMREIEEQFKNQINFVVVDGAAEKNYDLVSTLHTKYRFASPHRSHHPQHFDARIDRGSASITRVILIVLCVGIGLKRMG